MAGPPARAANALVLPTFLLLVLALHPGIDLNGSGNIVWVIPRRDQAAGDLHAMSTLRCGAERLNCERYRQVCVPPLLCCCASVRCHGNAARASGTLPMG